MTERTKKCWLILELAMVSLAKKEASLTQVAAIGGTCCLEFGRLKDETSLRIKQSRILYKI